MLLLFASAVLASSALVKPNHVPADQPTSLHLALPGPFECQVGQPFVRLNLTDFAAQGGAYLGVMAAPSIYPSVQFVKTNHLKEHQYTEISFFSKTARAEALKADFDYFDPHATGTSHITMEVMCGKIDFKVKAPNSALVIMSTLQVAQPLQVVVFNHPLVNKTITLAPALVQRKEIHSLTLSAEWPKACSGVFKPTIKLSIDNDTILGGGALSSDPNPNYEIYGLLGSEKAKIMIPKDNNTIISDNFQGLEFTSLATVKNETFALQFKYLAPNIPDATVNDTQIDVAFFCDGVELLAYTKANQLAPEFKINAAFAASPALLLACLLSLAALA